MSLLWLFASACEERGAQAVVVPPGFTGPVVVVAHAPIGSRAGAPIEANADGIAFTTGATRPSLVVHRAAHRGGTEKLNVYGSRAEVTLTRCGCYARWLLPVDDTSDERLAERDGEALRELLQMLEQRGACDERVAEVELCPGPEQSAP